MINIIVNREPVPKEDINYKFLASGTVVEMTDGTKGIVYVDNMEKKLLLVDYPIGVWRRWWWAEGFTTDFKFSTYNPITNVLGKITDITVKGE